MLEIVLVDCKTTVAAAKEAEVLSLLATSINKMKNIIAPSVPAILEAVFECTLQMITKNFEDFPEHRVNFFKLLQAVNDFCFEALFGIPLEHQKAGRRLDYGFLSRNRPPKFIDIASRAFRWWWLFVVAVHSVCGLFLGYVGAFYLYLVDSAVITDLGSYSITIPAEAFPAVANMYFTLASTHGLLVVLIVFRSIRAHWLVFRTHIIQLMSGTDPAKGYHERHAQARHPPARTAVYLRKAARAFFAASDVRHKNYGGVFLSRELLLTLLQTYQTYRLSCLVPRVWMNNVMVGLLVLNCWATPLLSYLFQSNVGRVRLGGALVNMVLDMAMYIGLPVALLLPYAGEFNRDLKQFERVYYYSDIWLIEAINEARMIFITSMDDAISKCLIALSVTKGLHSITKLICRADSTRTRHSGRSEGSLVAPFASRALHPVPVSHPRSPVRSRLEHFGHRLLFLWGLLVLVVHLQASTLRAYSVCRLPIRPWFGRQPSCALLEINCIEEHATGSAMEIDKILGIFDPARIKHLVIRHCPLLVIPPRIQTLRTLMGIKIFNSTILQWSDEASVTNTHHPALRFVFVVHTKMRELPIGLQSPDFPLALRDIEFSRTNLTVLPETLDVVWPTGLFLYFEECQLQEVPPVLVRLQPMDLGLTLNNISTIPGELLTSFPIRLLRISGNPITSPPSTLSASPQLRCIDLIDTQIEDLPSWMNEAFLASTFVIAGNTPLCDRLVAAGNASATEPRTLVGIPGIDCTRVFFGDGPLNWYPIDLESELNPTYAQP